MCKAIANSGKICARKHKNGEYCYQHQKINENRQLKEKEIKIIELEEENKNLISEIESMKEDFEKYQIIKRYEGLKLNLAKYVDKVNDLYAVAKFLTNDKNKPILLNIIGEKNDYLNYYNKLRIKRNKVSHFI